MHISCLTPLLLLLPLLLPLLLNALYCCTNCNQVEEKMRQDREEKQARRAEVEARISANLRMATAAEAARKSAFYSKKEAHEAHRAAMAEERQRERDAAAAAALAAEQKRAAIVSIAHFLL
jgi:hypothetical protein